MVLAPAWSLSASEAGDGAWGSHPPPLPASPQGSLPDLKGTQARWRVGICLVLEEKQPQIGFQGFESLHALLPVFSK